MSVVRALFRPADEFGPSPEEARNGRPRRRLFRQPTKQPGRRRPASCNAGAPPPPAPPPAAAAAAATTTTAATTAAAVAI